MKINDLNNLTKIDGLYNLFDYTFVGNEAIALYAMVLTERHEMRPDLISIDLYGDDTFVSTIMSINNIKNPLSFKKGMVVIHTDLITAQTLNTYSEKVDTLRKQLINKSKKKRTDQARSDFKSAEKTREASKATRPSIASANKEKSVELRDGVILISPEF